MKTLGHITLFTIMVASAFLTAFLGVHVLLSVAVIYSLPFISTLSFSQAYGFWITISLLKYSLKKEKVEKSSENIYVVAFTNIVTIALAYLFFWGAAAVMFNIIN
jgi:hypothetical protein